MQSEVRDAALTLRQAVIANAGRAAFSERKLADAPGKVMLVGTANA